MSQRIFRLLLSASFERSSFSRIQPGFAFSKNCDVLEYMENFSGIGPEVTNRKTIREPRKHRPRRNQRGTKKMATAAESRKKSRPTRAARQELLRRKDGATTAEIAKATGWQSHTIRAFLSAHVAKKMGPGVESVKNEDGERVYRIIPQDHGRDHSLWC